MSTDLARTTGGALSLAIKSRAELEAHGAAVVVLADVSGSMRGTRIDTLTQALRQLWPAMPKAALITFNSLATRIQSPDYLPHPFGSTNLRGALDMAAGLHPAKVLVISDGEPDDRSGALDAADLIPGVIDVLYVGDDGERDCIQFMQELASRGGGSCVVNDVAKTRLALDAPISALLGLPAPVAL